MTHLQQIEKEAFALPDADRAALAAHLLQTLPGVLSDEDEGVAEAVRRGRELDADPSASLTWSQLKKGLKR